MLVIKLYTTPRAIPQGSLLEFENIIPQNPIPTINLQSLDMISGPLEPATSTLEVIVTASALNLWRVTATRTVSVVLTTHMLYMSLPSFECVLITSSSCIGHEIVSCQKYLWFVG